jgi:1-acyl-sn-glycerol-3-phosphate acyltransferase
MFLLGLVAVAAVIPALRRFVGGQSLPWCESLVVNWYRAVGRILNLRIHITGQADPTAGLAVANHISWLDIIAIGAQRPYLFLAKEEVARWPVVGFLGRRIGTLFIRRGSAEQLATVGELMTWQLRQGKRLMLFPEGTTTRGERVLRFHGKLFQPAQRVGASVQPIALRYACAARGAVPFVGEDEFLPHLLALLKLERIDLHLHYCPALPAGLTQDQLARTTRLQIIEALGPAYPPAATSLGTLACSGNQPIT